LCQLERFGPVRPLYGEAVLIDEDGAPIAGVLPTQALPKSSLTKTRFRGAV
jgi:hypothetical protein